MTTILQKVVAQMGEEYTRLEAFLSDLNKGCSWHESVETPKLVVLTKNHGHFLIDSGDVLKLLERRRDEFKETLAEHTVLGENIKALRPSPVGST